MRMVASGFYRLDACKWVGRLDRCMGILGDGSSTHVLISDGCIVDGSGRCFRAHMACAFRLYSPSS